MEYDVLVVGAGLSGLTFARRYSDKNPGKKILVIDRRSHIGGNCFDEVTQGVLVHRYGPHTFHTDDEEVWRFLSRFTKWIDYTLKVVAEYKGRRYPLPINRDTINMFFGVGLKDIGEVKAFLKEKAVDVDEVKNSRDYIVSRFGVQLYEAFIESYTKKQWNLYPHELPADVLARLPVRYDGNDRYFNDRYEGLPQDGYASLFEKMADKKEIALRLDTDYKEIKDDYVDVPLLVYTGRIDEFFDYKHGLLPYRHTRFEFETLDRPEYQCNAIVNYPELKYPYTRIVEYKKMPPQESPKTVICREYLGDEGVLTYPVPIEENRRLYERYEGEAPDNVHFLGRLGRYRYLNMDVACRQALDLADQL